MKRYILKKDLPDVKAGEVFELGKDATHYFMTTEETPAGKMFYAYPKSFVESNPEWFELVKPVVKPPLGLIPLWAHRMDRLNDINQGIARFQAAGVDVPYEWICEKQTLEGWLRDY